MKFKDVQKPIEKKAFYSARVKEETRKFLRDNKVDLDKVVEELRKSEGERI